MRNNAAFMSLSLLILSAACSRTPSEKPAPPAVPPLELTAAAPRAESQQRVESALPAGARVPQARMPTAKLTFPDGGSITVQVADTPEAREKGLMFRRALAPDYGMLFIFPEEQMLQFWMKNTLVSLDMIWLDGERRITGVHPDVPASREDTPEAALARRTGTGKFVLELPAGQAARRGLKPGARLEFSWNEASQ